MGLIQYSGLLNGIHGKINGSVFCRNRTGNIIKTKATPINQKSQSQTANRASLLFLSKYWALLTEQQRTDWNVFALTVTNTNYFGQTYNPSGFNTFCRLNQNLYIIGGKTIYSNPLTKNVIALVDPVVSDIAVDNGTYIINFPLQSTSDDTTHAIYASPDVSAGVSYNKKNFKIIGYIPANTANSFNVYAAYVAVFGQPLAGRKIFTKIRAVSKINGFDSVILQTSTIVKQSIAGIGTAIIESSFILQ